jgi:hypothetical protein
MVTRQQVTSSSISNSRWIMSAIEQQAAAAAYLASFRPV